MSVLASNRSETSHLAGGLVLNSSDDSARYSRDFDIFHDSVADLVAASERDVAALVAAGFDVRKLERAGEWSKPASFRKARVQRGEDKVDVDWSHDSAFRFFPIVPDELLGWRLHLFDMATNKALALSARTETRDYVDIVELSRIYPLEAIIWAACGKDAGFNPLSLFEMVMRFARIDPVDLDKIKARHLDPVALKQEWIAASDQAREEMTALADEKPDTPIGVAFVDAVGEPGWIRRNPALRVHHPSLRGCWPVVH
ncbi:MAG: nucleotidyl transferase AbiEii/AbiGii toxin family protein [Chthoniobacterales bacterium]